MMKFKTIGLSAVTIIGLSLKTKRRRIRRKTMTMRNKFFALTLVCLAVLIGAAGECASMTAAVSDSGILVDVTKPPYGAVESSPGYNCWPMIGKTGNRLVCMYTAGKYHDPSEKGRSVYAKYSDDGGKTWSDRKLVFKGAACGASPIGKGVDECGAALFWVRRLGIEPRMALYRTRNGIDFELVSTPEMKTPAMQITDIFRTPTGLMCLWFSDDYSRNHTNKCWWAMASVDEGRSWEQHVIERDLALGDWPTEPSVAVLGGGRLLGIARSEGGKGAQFQIVSEDWGKTWKRFRTNIDDVLDSTPSLIYDEKSGIVFNYYFQRGAGVLKCRRAKAATVWTDPSAWGEPEIIAYGEKNRPFDSGNANAIAFGEENLIAFYAGDEKNCRVVVSHHKQTR